MIEQGDQPTPESQEAQAAIELFKKEGFIFSSKYGKIVVDTKNKLKSALPAESGCDGVLHFSYYPHEFTIRLRTGSLEGFSFRHGALAAKNEWVCKGSECADVSIGEVMRALDISLARNKEGRVMLRSYRLRDLHPPYTLQRPPETRYYVALIDYHDPAIEAIVDERPLEEILGGKHRVVEASLQEADKFIRNGDLKALKKYFASWKEIRDAGDVTFHEMKTVMVPAADDWGYEPQEYAFPDFYEYLVFDDARDIETMKNDLKETTLNHWFEKITRKMEDELGYYGGVGSVRVGGINGKIWIMKDGAGVDEEISKSQLREIARREIL